MNSDYENYMKFLQGDKDSLAPIVSAYNDKLVLFLFSYVKSMSIAEDLAADTFLYLLIKKPALKEVAAFKTWLFRVAANKAIDYLRKSKRFPEISLEDANLEMDIYYHNAEQTVIQNAETAKMYAALSSLSADYQTVLQLLYFEEMSYKQIAKVMKKTEKQIKNLAYNARNAAKTALQKEGFSYEIK